MITIEYAEDNRCGGYMVEAVADYAVNEWVADNVHSPLSVARNAHVYTSTANVIFEIRARVAEGSLPHGAVRFKYHDEIIRVDCNGELDKYPEGFCDQQHNALMRLI